MSSFKMYSMGTVHTVNWHRQRLWRWRFGFRSQHLTAQMPPGVRVAYLSLHFTQLGLSAGCATCLCCSQVWKKSVHPPFTPWRLAVLSYRLSVEHLAAFFFLHKRTKILFAFDLFTARGYSLIYCPHWGHFISNKGTIGLMCQWLQNIFVIIWPFKNIVINFHCLCLSCVAFYPGCLHQKHIYIFFLTEFSWMCFYNFSLLHPSTEASLTGV